MPPYRLDGRSVELCIQRFGLSESPIASYLPLLFLISTYRDHGFPMLWTSEHIDAGGFDDDAACSLTRLPPSLR